MGGEIARRALARADILVLFALVLAASWAFVAWMTLDMSHPVVQLMMPFESVWSLATMVAVFFMWSGMMVAMMLPSAAPMILTFHAIERRGTDPGLARRRTLIFVAAYLVIWVGFSVLAVGMQWLLQVGGLVSPMIVSRSQWLTAALLVLAGSYQFTPLKQSCLRACRTPMGFVMTEWRDGLAGAWRMGWKHGLYCAGCCWALMLLLFVAGVMNPIWIVFLTGLVVVEKWPGLPEWISAGLGVGLIALGVAQLI